MNWKWLLGGLMTVVVLGIAGYFGYPYVQPYLAPYLDRLLGIDRFAWGVDVSAFALHQPDQLYSPNITAKKIQDLKNLGVSHVRTHIELTPESKLKPELNDDWIGQLSAAGLKIYGILEPNLTEPIDLTKDYETIGYTLGQQVASRYAGKIQYYQLANEITGVVVRKDTDTGPVIKGKFGVDYDQNGYLRVSRLVKGMARALREADPKAQIVLTGHATYSDVFELLQRDNIPFDVVGWAWYSDYPQNEFSLLMSRLKTFGKPIWLAESNQYRGSYEDGTKTLAQGEADQARYLGQMAQLAKATEGVAGFFVFSLYDDPHAGLPEDQHWGIMRVSSTGQSSAKLAFQTYQSIIREFN